MSTKHAPCRTAPAVILTALLALFSSLFFRCARERPLQPKPAVGPELHERWEDQEAEELALWLSADVIAPRPLYDRVKSDLAQIRAQWSDTLPLLNEIRYRFPAESGRILIRVQDSVRNLILSGSYHDFDSLNAVYGFASAGPAYAGLLEIRFNSRLNSCYLVPLYERLPGICVVSLDFWSSLSCDGVYACREGDSILYIFQRGAGYPFCKPAMHYAFRAQAGQVEYLGQKPASGDSTVQPDWWREVMACIADREFCDPARMHQRIDWLPPARVTDLRVLEPQTGRAAKVVFTTPGDDGIEGSCASLVLAAAYVPLTESNWNTAPYWTEQLGGGPGDNERVATLTMLSGTESSYVAVRAADCRNNWSAVSNNVRLVNKWLNGWAVFPIDNFPLSDLRITSLRMVSAGRLWVGTWGGISSFQDGLWSDLGASNQGLAGERINGIDEDSHGTVWIAATNGLYSHDGATWTIYKPPQGVYPSDVVSSVSVGNDDAVWCGLSGAVGRFSNGIWTRYAPETGGLSGSSIMAVLADADGMTWVGTNFGLNRFDGASWVLFDPANSGIAGPYVQSIFQTESGAILCGSYNGAISRYSHGAWTIVTGNLQIAASCYADAGNAIWVGVAQGLWRFDGSWRLFDSNITPLHSDNISALATENDHTIWIGTAVGGLYRWDLQAAGLAGGMTREAVSIR